MGSSIYDLKVMINPVKSTQKPSFLSRPEAEKVLNFHQTIASYQPTPLLALNELAKKLGVERIYVKDESHRFGLNAFKALGGTYAMAKMICKILQLPDECLDFNYLSSPEIKQKSGQLTFVTATDGNHGRGVAWSAAMLGQKAVVYLPKGTAKARVDAILETGSEAVVTDVNYDQTVRLAMQQAKENRWYLVQDSAWVGYTEVPSWVMQGYMTMVYETMNQLKENGWPWPTHIFLQAGVGSMPAAVLGMLVNCPETETIKPIIVEPHNAACIYYSAACNDGNRHAVTGDLQTIMAGLACGEPNLIAWDILRDFSYAFVSLEDFFASRGVRILGHSAGGDPGIISGESGAVGVGLLSLAMEKPELYPVKKALGFDHSSRVLVLNTEGDTDPENYRDIVWDGKYPLPFARELTYHLDRTVRGSS